MRIVSGKYRGKTINPPKNFKARPTTDFAKEALFNILVNHFDFGDMEVLDLFSGTGSISYEFLSRGVKSAELVEKNFTHCEFINKTIKEMGIQNARCIKSDAFIYIERMSRAFDLIFADPPYELEGLETLPDKILNSKLLKEDSWFILEHGKSHKFNNHPACFDQRNYGSVYFSFFRNPKSNS
ncbi:MAG: 16S rRNA (guanine(966)-N(2))-methyltransferase RsmD [Bacteroidales bacterium]|nr:16S rRNA (guanine(966)-N(2))-methyltransferase RsmD [Bacteroidales bacterium]MCB8999859.1 16S rRNA (guanine(966)-N(2))-methyltransferase RsmD [Bacteroidales bacterium]